MLIVVVVVVDVVVVVVVVGKLIFWLQEFQGSALILPGCFAYGDEIRGSCCSCFALPYNFPNWAPRPLGREEIIGVIIPDRGRT